MDAITLFIVDDHEIVREGLRSLIDANIPNCQVVGEANDGREGLRLIRQTLPDIVIMDIAMPDLNGVDATRQILKFVPDCKVIALSMHGSIEFVTQMLSAGARGYIKKDESFSELAAAIESVRSGQVFLGKGVADILVDDYKRLQVDSEELQSYQLTPRERQVLQLVAEGNRTRDIAEQLSLSTKTVESHRSRIMRKLGMDTIADLTKYAIRAGITSLDP